jgi:hypothetical protein
VKLPGRAANGRREALLYLRNFSFDSLTRDDERDKNHEIMMPPDAFAAKSKVVNLQGKFSPTRKPGLSSVSGIVIRRADCGCYQSLRRCCMQGYILT